MGAEQQASPSYRAGYQTNPPTPPPTTHNQNETGLVTRSRSREAYRQIGRFEPKPRILVPDSHPGGRMKRRAGTKSMSLSGLCQVELQKTSFIVTRLQR